MFPFQNMFNCMAEILRAIQTVNTFSLTHLVHPEQIPCTGIGRKNHGIPINHDQTFLHIFCNKREFFLLLFCQFQLLLDLPVLFMDFT